MNIETMRALLLGFTDVTEDEPFGPDYLVYRIAGKIFAALSLERTELVCMKCEPEYAAELREHYDGIRPAWHWNKQHWNDVYFDSDVNDDLIEQLARHAYGETIKSLPQKLLYGLRLPSPRWQHRHFAQLDSTMSFLKDDDSEAQTAEFLLVTADYQTAGHGQKDAVWESAAQANLLLGISLHPSFLTPDKQFLLSAATALAVADAVQKYCKCEACVKWPNDIYINDNKVCGMLLEHTLCGRAISRSIIGIGLNINQKAFEGDAPNPVSFIQVRGKETDRAAVLRHFLQRFEHYYSLLQNNKGEQVLEEYVRRMYRREGNHRYADAHGNFLARLETVAPDGTLHLRDLDGNLRQYLFKEVSYLS